MGMAAIIVMWPGPFEQTVIPPLIYLTAYTNFYIIDYNSFWKIEHLMLHSNFQGHRPFGSREGNFSCLLTLVHILGVGGGKIAVIEEKKFKHSPWAGVDKVSL